MVAKTGILYGISVGTGDPDLITVKGVRLLQQASVVAFPMGVGNQSGIAQTIISPWLISEQETCPLSFPYVQNEEELRLAWKQSAEQVWSYLQQGKDVAFACEGDISFYSTFTYLAQTLTYYYPSVKIKTVPGVCSPMAVASVLNLPLTVRNQRLAVLPVLYTLEDLEQTLGWADVVVLLKVSSVYPQVWEILRRLNLLEHAWVVERATQPGQVIYDELEKQSNLRLSYFSLLIVHVKPSDPHS
ncbi:precorrin-2 methyltransferase [cyanobacterium endosymbiont of Rhopalodia gibberula]|uniref:precorrin-2 C(20)-methyltransferase n=1 Tax=cyanobacterium endosymbiont of Rhopalodia gibberula TaxID=1763363 RepID=UPI000DC7239E|nr:precorrin-2 C(20)-methyltransferase [cyanobacterium endosymbiont of Rhopalodia gibberula]BBA79770.1 precorrin-2 methyltransferase [cyanobacterium endosymbiont of Rhopalodia gibberula]